MDIMTILCRKEKTSLKLISFRRQYQGRLPTNNMVSISNFYLFENREKGIFSEEYRADSQFMPMLWWKVRSPW